GGGVVALDDLWRVQVRGRQPIESTDRGYRVVSMPLASSGGFIVSALLNVLEREQARAGGYRPDRFLHAMIEAEKRLYAVRQRLGDPDFNPGVEERVRRMVAKDFAGDLGRQIGEQATPTAQVVVQQEHGTTHVSAVDEEGNAVALNTTVNVIDDGMPVARAIAQPRLHHNLYPDLVRVEPSGLEAATARALEQRGHKLQFGGEPFQDHGPGFFDTLWGKACGIQIDADTRWRVAACDVRNDRGGAIPQYPRS